MPPHLFLAGYSVAIFEKTEDVGGVWQQNYAGYRLQVRLLLSPHGQLAADFGRQPAAGLGRNWTVVGPSW